MRVIITGNKIDVWLLSKYFTTMDINFSTIYREDRRVGNLMGLVKQVLWCDLVHILSLKLCGVEGIAWILILSILRIMGKKTIIHWMGTDVLDLSPTLGWCVSKLVDRHLAYSTWLVEELRDKNVESTWLPVLPPLEVVPTPLPREFTVLVYLGGNESNIDFYGNVELEGIVKELPDVRFLILGRVSNGDRIKSSNVQYLGGVGYEDMNAVYEKCTVLLRQTKHDGLAFMVLEALARGKYVVWSQKFPYCFEAVGISDAVEHLQRLRQVKDINTESINFIYYKFDNNKWIDELLGIYSEILGESYVVGERTS